jgi:vancomycin permeability regulator SanA
LLWQKPLVKSQKKTFVTGLLTAVIVPHLSEKRCISDKAFDSVYEDAQEISKMLWNIVKTTSEYTGN